MDQWNGNIKIESFGWPLALTWNKLVSHLLRLFVYVEFYPFLRFPYPPFCSLSQRYGFFYSYLDPSLLCKTWNRCITFFLEKCRGLKSSCDFHVHFSLHSIPDPPSPDLPLFVYFIFIFLILPQRNVRVVWLTCCISLDVMNFGRAVTRAHTLSVIETPSLGHHPRRNEYFLRLIYISFSFTFFSYLLNSFKILEKNCV